MFQDLADENSLDDAVLDSDDFPIDDEELDAPVEGRTPENLIRDEDGDEYGDDDDEDPLFDSFEDRDLL
ncbi:hypothetical protein A3C89_02325 [Candidatus Kaiserbacteria bacterium RIFCSPHIGHO2_02_FULL_50_50]|uniref:Uncharacterized protein n=1 Tax=Candidatus Kaiserbacteria bacterium RIFCSPHIGHO2_02_FULL_50_50 TaxID=1798492 RepID=A0A1F6DFV4_9BACT|nr:MAG: hypothetical protein A3C89_02325 [Candidatus Kaiserbacteria bacterium RIFCSPHIGHO2_02_FULL_50_50]OGG88632.1 MAG: hypothetical protein A3G62_00870 [Candidatus Kaiserbacteria bacterium RIFCSPLOWO2_12_FULL_50_10]